MDLNKRSQYAAEERLEISQAMQIALLDQIAKKLRWSMGDAAFHGGTCISTAWNSPRWSEDIDFLLSSNLRDSLMKAVPKIASAVRLQMDLAYPGCVIEFQVTPGDETKTDVIDVWHVKWQHPNRIGKVLVKAEFYATDPDLMTSYQSTLARPSGHGVSVSVVLPVGDLVSLWADKVKAIATREGFKWRDAHDLGFVADSLDRRGWPAASELLVALSTSASIYGKTLADVRKGLEARLEEGHFANTSAFITDMSRWYPDDMHVDFADRGLFDQFLTRSTQEIQRAIGLIIEADHEPDAYTP